MASLCLDIVSENDEGWALQVNGPRFSHLPQPSSAPTSDPASLPLQIRQRKFQMHNKEWLEVVDEDEAEEYQDAVALNNAMASLHQQPLDASALQDAGGLGEEDDLEDSYKRRLGRTNT